MSFLYLNIPFKTRKGQSSTTKGASDAAALGATAQSAAPEAPEKAIDYNQERFVDLIIEQIIQFYSSFIFIFQKGKSNTKTRFRW